jgi:hypothetical protein
MTNQRARTIQGVIDEHKRLLTASKKSKPSRPLNTLIPSMNPIARWYKDRDINPDDVRRRDNV